MRPENGWGKPSVGEEVSGYGSGMTGDA